VTAADTRAAATSAELLDASSGTRVALGVGMRLATTMLMVLWIMLPGCGSSTVDDRDAGADLSVTAEGQPCVTQLDCKSGSFVCAYPIKDGCSAVGHCALIHTPTCAHERYVCGCHGESVNDSDCYYEQGMAGAPVSSTTFCGDGGTGI
jgi:hypothetical protein